MNSLKRTTDLVKHLMNTCPETRSSDDILYREVCKVRCPNVMSLPFGLVISNRKTYNIPPYETVKRTRQKVQEHNPELAAVPEVEAMRAVKEDEFKAYARKVTV